MEDFKKEIKAMPTAEIEEFLSHRAGLRFSYSKEEIRIFKEELALRADRTFEPFSQTELEEMQCEDDRKQQLWELEQQIASEPTERLQAMLTTASRDEADLILVEIERRESIEKAQHRRSKPINSTPKIVPKAAEKKQPEFDRKSEKTEKPAVADSTEKPTFIMHIFDLLGIICGIVSIIFGVSASEYGIGRYENAEQYVGDAFTGIQGASAQTANNIQALAKLIRFGLTALLIIFGIALICYFGSKLLKKNRQ